MKYLVPVARGSLEDCQQMAEAFARHKFTSRHAGQLYAAWREASPQIRQRLLEQPQLFLKVQREAEPAVASPLQELLRDLEMVAAIAHRANRRLRKVHTEFEQLPQEPSELLRQSLALALQELQRLATRIPEARPGKEEHVESESTNRDSGTACTGSEETRDRAGVGISRLTVRKVLRSNSTQVPALQRAEKTEPYRQQILELLPRCKGNLVRVHEELTASGAVLSYQAPDRLLSPAWPHRAAAAGRRAIRLPARPVIVSLGYGEAFPQSELSHVSSFGFCFQRGGLPGFVDGSICSSAFRLVSRLARA